jgi:hypothetical protein
LVIDAADNVVVTGQASSGFPTTPGAYDESYSDGGDAFVAKISASGANLIWSTVLGATGLDSGRALTLDASQSIVLTGITDSGAFPTTPGAYDRTSNGYYDAFVTKLSSEGSVLEWSTFLGGNNIETGLSLALDARRDVVVTGYTASPNFPTTPGAYDGSLSGGRDAFVTKLSAGGSCLVWSTFLGGNSIDAALSLALDASGSPLVTGETYSPDFPTTPGAFDRSFNSGQTDAFVSGLSPSGSTLLWSTFLGGASHEYGAALAVDRFGSVVVAGVTESANFPVSPEAYDSSFNGYLDAFVTKFSPARLQTQHELDFSWSSFLGGSSIDGGLGLTLDASGNALVTGEAGPGFPTSPAVLDDSPNGGVDVFVAHLALDVRAESRNLGSGGPRAFQSGAGNRLEPSTRIRFSLQRQGPATLRVFDATGRHVATLFDGIASAGQHEVNWDSRFVGPDPAGGVYFYHLRTNETSVTGKVLRLR